MRYANITYPDINNGLGYRVTIWINGCSHHCPGCQNPSTWDFNQGDLFSEKTITEIYNILEKPYIKGITLSGGDPLDSDADCYTFLKDVKKKFPNKDIWCYTGYTLEELEKKGCMSIKFIDYLVDGEFKKDKRDITLAFRGSSNQRILHNVDGIFKDVSKEFDK